MYICMYIYIICIYVYIYIYIYICIYILISGRGCTDGTVEDRFQGATIDSNCQTKTRRKTEKQTNT